MNNWQQQAAAFAQKHNLIHDPRVHTLDLLSELGEVAQAWLRATDYGRRPLQARAAVAAELGDTLYSLCVLAHALEIDLDDALQATLQKYEARRQQHGHPGNTP